MSEAPTRPEIDGFTLLGDFLSTLNTDTVPKDLVVPELKYREFSEPFNQPRPAYLLAEGVGVHATYQLRGHVVLRGNTLIVSAMGTTAASRLGTVSWFATARLYDGILDIAAQNLGNEGDSLWPKDHFDPIGHTTFTLPMPPRPLRLVLTAGYFYSSGSGQLAPGTTEVTFDIEVESQ
ncbi:hypothetical protein [Billgrantia ethanolica]|uniref:Uncharacterized protein n=1 Tax=Billgrantia ethanolica TaxID=2733486 RepID=A0ABS9A567_9GAMM|nr:hypothetical protein [Halomonas ethanolica]MCE8003977.1 hypothetical protein [Halomonas ethanolica]